MLTATAVEGLPEIEAGADLAALIAAALTVSLEPTDVLVVAHKSVSKAEGRVRVLAEVVPSQRALELAAAHNKDPRHVQVVLDESRELLRAVGGTLICVTHHGFVCANAGVDLSNVPDGQAALLPLDADRSARHIRDALRARTGLEIAVVISDTFGRPWRTGLTDVAIGCAGIAAVVDLRGTRDAAGRELAVTEVCIADEMAAAAELAKGKTSGVPVVVVRGVDRSWFRESSVRGEVVRPYSQDLFR
jgi:coenzyme F420-0:L-glutamate ligase / coenzyme F420-1:gamma-L-glutamate ligase